MRYTCINISFDRQTGEAYVVDDQGRVFKPHDPLAARLVILSARELAELIGCQFKAEGRMCVGFVPRELELATGSDDSTDLAAIDGESSGAAPVKEDRRVRLERYGLGVSIEAYGAHRRLVAYVCDKRGAMAREGVIVTKPSPEFLAAVNEALGTSLAIDDPIFATVDELVPVPR